MPIYIYRIQPARPEMLSDGPTADEARITAERFAYLQRLKDQGALLAGRTLNSDYSAFGIAIFQARDDAPMRWLTLEDPGAAQKLFRVEWQPFRIALLADELAVWTSAS